MATSRLEKIGTILTRIDGLLKSGAMKWEDRPLWYDVYRAFPPKDEPLYSKPAPDIPVRAIFYEEDTIRAQFQNNNKKNLGTVNMFRNDSITKTKKFINIYKQLEATGIVNKEELYENAVQMVNKDMDKQREEMKEKEPSLVETFKQAQEQQKVDVSKLFKD